MNSAIAVTLKPAAWLALLWAMPVATAQAPAESGVAAESHYTISSERSWLRVLVYRGGLLRGLGHNHVVAHNNISGSATVHSEPLSADFAVELSVADFSIDDTDIRNAEGEDFAGAIPAKDIAGTRDNLLGRKLLDAESFPTIQLRAEEISGDWPTVDVSLVATVRGREFRLTVPTSVVLSDDNFFATGEFSLTHREIGLSPFKAALGALRVRDEMLIKFEIHGDNIGDGHNTNNLRD